MAEMSIKARVYVCIVIVLGAWVLLENLPLLPNRSEEWVLFVLLTVSAATAQLFPVNTPKNQAYELTLVFVFAALLLLPPGALVLLIVLAFIPEWARAGKPWYIQLFNISIYLLQAHVAGALYRWVGGSASGVLGEAAGLIAAVLAAGLFAFVNHLLLALLLRMARKRTWRETGLFELDYFLIDATLACLGAIATLLWESAPWQLVLLGAPLFLIYRALNTPNLQEAARSDPKTGLYNAKHFNQVLREEFPRAVRFGRPLAIIMADLDLLRDINNSCGHLAGDAVIKGVADIIRRELRDYDIAARFGGEEFVMLLPETSTDQALAVAERLREQVEAARFPVATSVEPIRATLSLGVASYPADGARPEDVIHQADLAVSYAKLNGRNRACAPSLESRAQGIAMVSHRNPDATVWVGSPRSALADRRRSSSETDMWEDGPEDAGRAGQTAQEPGAGSEGIGGGEEGSARRTEGTNRSFAARGRRRNWRRERSSDLALPVALYIAATTAVVLALWAVVRPWEADLDWLGMGVLALMTVGTQSLAIEIYGRGRISTSAVVIMAGGMIFGMPAALFLASVVPVTVWVWNRSPLHRVLFDAGATTLAAAATVIVYEQIAARIPGGALIPLAALAVVAALVYYLVNVGLISAAIGLSEGRSPFEVWDEKFRWLPLHYEVFGLLALLIALAYQALAIYGLISFLVPPVMLRYVMKQYMDHTERNVAELKRVNEELVAARDELVSTLDELRATYDNTLEALSAALDSRDTETEGHSRRVVEYTAAIARELALTGREIRGLLNGALLHDVGKIGIPDAILAKRGPLTSAEWDKMKTHPEQGYRMLERVGFLADALPVIRYHHERFDGSGYPDGLQGEQIPLGARIFAVADSFDAMTSDRPYRPGCSPEVALAEIARCSGSQFDPEVVDAILRVGVGELARVIGRSDRVTSAKDVAGPAVREPIRHPRLAVVPA